VVENKHVVLYQELHVRPPCATPDKDNGHSPESNYTVGCLESNREGKGPKNIVHEEVLAPNTNPGIQRSIHVQRLTISLYTATHVCSTCTVIPVFEFDQTKILELAMIVQYRQHLNSQYIRYCDQGSGYFILIREIMTHERYVGCRIQIYAQELCP
jgi:hypothetical protein